MEISKLQLEKIKNGKGFIAALDQSGGSTPKALLSYGITEKEYKTEKEMFDLIHKMRTRVITNKSFSSDKILGAILFEKTLNESINGVNTAEYLWETKKIVPFLKIDDGLLEKNNDVQLMKDIANLDDRLKNANAKKVFGTKMRSVIFANNKTGIAEIVKQQFEVGLKILSYGIIPILEPEVNIDAKDKVEIELTLKNEILKNLNKLPEDKKVMLKITIPSVNNFYSDLIKHDKVIRVVALSGGYPLEKANNLLYQNNGLIASFSRVLLDPLNINQSDEEFTKSLGTVVDSIYKASLS